MADRTRAERKPNIIVTYGLRVKNAPPITGLCTLESYTSRGTTLQEIAFGFVVSLISFMGQLRLALGENEETITADLTRETRALADRLNKLEIGSNDQGGAK